MKFRLTLGVALDHCFFQPEFTQQNELEIAAKFLNLFFSSLCCEPYTHFQKASDYRYAPDQLQEVLAGLRPGKSLKIIHS